MKKFATIFLFFIIFFATSFSTVIAIELPPVLMYQPGGDCRVPTVKLPTCIHAFVGVVNDPENVQGELWEIDGNGRVVSLVCDDIPLFYIPAENYFLGQVPQNSHLLRLKPGRCYMVMVRYRSSYVAIGDQYSWSFWTTEDPFR